jgi:hypothetical protein
VLTNLFGKFYPGDRYMQKNILLNLVGAGVLALLCACGTSDKPATEETKKEACATVPADAQQAAANVTAQAETPATEAAAPATAEAEKVAVNQTEAAPVQAEENKTAEQKA